MHSFAKGYSLPESTTPTRQMVSDEVRLNTGVQSVPLMVKEDQDSLVTSV